MWQVLLFFFISTTTTYVYRIKKQKNVKEECVHDGMKCLQHNRSMMIVLHVCFVFDYTRLYIVGVTV